MSDECFIPGDVIRFKRASVSSLFSWKVTGEWDSDNPFSRQEMSSLVPGSQINGSDVTAGTCFTVIAHRTVTMEECELTSPKGDGKHEFLLLMRPGGAGAYWFRHHSDAFEKV